MANRDEPDGKVEEVASPAQVAPGDLNNNEPLKAEGVAKKREGNNRRFLSRLGRLREGLITSRNTSRKIPNIDTLEPTADVDGTLDEAPNGSDITVKATRWALRRDIPVTILAWSGIVYLFIWAAGRIAGTILLLVIAALLAYALAPAVKFLERVLPRFLAILFVYLIVLGGISALLYFIVRTAIDQVSSLSTYIGFLLTPGKNGQPTPLQHTLSSFGISQSQIESAQTQLTTQIGGITGSIVPLLSGIFSVILDIILVAVLSVYILADGSRVSTWLRRNMPSRQQGRVRFLLNTLQRIVGGYIRGQLFLCGLIGVLVGVGMEVIGVPYAILLGVLAFVLEFIPVLGTLVSGVICVLLALTKGWLWAVIVLAYFVFVHIIEGDILGPRVVGKAIGLHPIVSLAALVAGAELFGIWGALFASPIAGVLQALLIAIWSEWREMHPQEFHAAKNKIAEKVEENVADKTLDARTDIETSGKLLSYTNPQTKG
jgi:predicted PurR-regulated permease PerM